MAGEPDRGPERAAVPRECAELERELVALLRRVDPVPEPVLAAARAAVRE
jgi:hypothetical protein